MDVFEPNNGIVHSRFTSASLWHSGSTL